MNIVTPDAGLVRGVPLSGFVAQAHSSIVIRSVNTDRSARRIVVVAENGWRVSPSARKVESSVLRAVLANARTEDSFALLTAVGPRKALPFGTSRGELLSTIDELSTPWKGRVQDESVLGAILEAETWLKPAQAGDSILLLTMGIKPTEAEHEYGKAQKTLSTAGIRLFGFQLGNYYAGIYQAGVTFGPGGMRLPTASLISSEESMFGLADKTGGFFIEENTEGTLKTYHLTDDKLRELDELGGQTYKAIVEYYRVRLVDPPKDFAIDVTEAVRQKLSGAYLIYPRTVPACSVGGEAGPAASRPTNK